MQSGDTVKVNDLNKYKLALHYTKELNEILRIMNEAEHALLQYANYVPVRGVLKSIQDNKTIVEIHANSQQRVVDSKGLE